MSDNDPLLCTVENGVAYLTMNRPDKLNALSGEMSSSAIERLLGISRDPNIGCVVITGQGRAFCAGGDVSSMANRENQAPLTYEESIDKLRAGQEMPWLLHNIPKVTIAAVNGYAMGAGLGIAMCCDLRVASDKAKFGTAYAKVGFGGDYGVTWKLTHLVGQAKAKEMMFLADIIEADEARRVGLVNRVIPHDDLMSTVREMAETIASGPRVSYRWMKENINLAVHSTFRDNLDREALTHIRCSQTDDHKEGAKAFVEKRAPAFTGR
jgi:2-(1,2-epoxy-1,2-dihydrophenyl)acetyl-CoA isomerase